MSCQVTRNLKQKGIEIRFAQKPSEDILTKIKEKNFRWSKFNKTWWVTYTESLHAFALELCGEHGADLNVENRENPNQRARMITLASVSKYGVVPSNILAKELKEGKLEVASTQKPRPDEPYDSIPEKNWVWQEPNLKDWEIADILKGNANSGSWTYQLRDDGIIHNYNRGLAFRYKRDVEGWGYNPQAEKERMKADAEERLAQQFPYAKEDFFVPMARTAKEGNFKLKLEDTTDKKDLKNGDKVEFSINGYRFVGEVVNLREQKTEWRTLHGLETGISYDFKVKIDGMALTVGYGGVRKIDPSVPIHSFDLFPKTTTVYYASDAPTAFKIWEQIFRLKGYVLGYLKDEQRARLNDKKISHRDNAVRNLKLLQKTMKDFVGYEMSSKANAEHALQVTGETVAERDCRHIVWQNLIVNEKDVNFDVVIGYGGDTAKLNGLRTQIMADLKKANARNADSLQTVVENTGVTGDVENPQTARNTLDSSPLFDRLETYISEYEFAEIVEDVKGEERAIEEASWVWYELTESILAQLKKKGTFIAVEDAIEFRAEKGIEVLRFRQQKVLNVADLNVGDIVLNVQSGEKWRISDIDEKGEVMGDVYGLEQIKEEYLGQNKLRGFVLHEVGLEVKGIFPILHFERNFKRFIARKCLEITEKTKVSVNPKSELLSNEFMVQFEADGEMPSPFTYRTILAILEKNQNAYVVQKYHCFEIHLGQFEDNLWEYGDYSTFEEAFDVIFQQSPKVVKKWDERDSDGKLVQAAPSVPDPLFKENDPLYLTKDVSKRYRKGAKCTFSAMRGENVEVLFDMVSGVMKELMVLPVTSVSKEMPPDAYNAYNAMRDVVVAELGKPLNQITEKEFTKVVNDFYDWHRRDRELVNKKTGDDLTPFGTPDKKADAIATTYQALIQKNFAKTPATDLTLEHFTISRYINSAFAEFSILGALVLEPTQHNYSEAYANENGGANLKAMHSEASLGKIVKMQSPSVSNPEKDLAERIKDKFKHLSDGSLIDAANRKPDFKWDDELFELERRRKASNGAFNFKMDVDKIVEVPVKVAHPRTDALAAARTYVSAEKIEVAETTDETNVVFTSVKYYEVKNGEQYPRLVFRNDNIFLEAADKDDSQWFDFEDVVNALKSFKHEVYHYEHTQKKAAEKAATKAKLESVVLPNVDFKHPSIKELAVLYVAADNGWLAKDVVTNFKYALAGDSQKDNRQMLMSALRGVKVPIAQSGITSIESEIIALFDSVGLRKATPSVSNTETVVTGLKDTPSVFTPQNSFLLGNQLVLIQSSSVEEGVFMWANISLREKDGSSICSGRIQYGYNNGKGLEFNANNGSPIADAYFSNFVKENQKELAAIIFSKLSDKGSHLPDYGKMSDVEFNEYWLGKKPSHNLHKAKQKQPSSPLSDYLYTRFATRDERIIDADELAKIKHLFAELSKLQMENAK